MPDLHPYDAKRLREAITRHVSICIDEAWFDEDGGVSYDGHRAVDNIMTELEEIYGDLSA